MFSADFHYISSTHPKNVQPVYPLNTIRGGNTKIWYHSYESYKETETHTQKTNRTLKKTKNRYKISKHIS